MDSRFTVRGVAALAVERSAPTEKFWESNTERELAEAQASFEAWFERALGKQPFSEQSAAEDAINLRLAAERQQASERDSSWRWICWEVRHEGQHSLRERYGCNGERQNRH